MPQLRILALALATVGSVATASCGKFVRSGEPAAQVIFDNQSLDQVDVFAVLSAGQAQRIGTVFAGRTDTLDVPMHVINAGGTVSILARLLAHTYTPHTGPLTLNAGDRIRVTLPSTGRSLAVLPAP